MREWIKKYRKMAELNQEQLAEKLGWDWYKVGRIERGTQKITPQEILVAHDDLDLPPGCARLKLDGGEGGHNGLKDIVQHMGTKQFYRLRLGIGHPGDREEVLNYVLHRPSVSDKKSIFTAIDHALTILPDLIAGKLSHAMTVLHTIAK